MSRKLERTSTRIFDKAAQRGGDALFGLSADFPRLIEVDISRVHPNPDQPRRYFDETALAELAQSIERHGLKQPVLVQETDGDDYLLIAGERRLRACALAGRKTIFAILTDGDADELALIENIQRVDLGPLELARAFSRLIDRHDYTHDALGKVIGRSQAEVTRTLSLLRLPTGILEEFETLYRNVPKSILTEIAAVDDLDTQQRLWDGVKDGGTVKALREAKRAETSVEKSGTGKSGDAPKRPAHPPLRKLVESVHKLARDITKVDANSLNTERAGLDEQSRADLRRLRDLIDDLIAE